MPRDGHVGAFSFGRSYGIIETALAAAQIPFRTVRPQVWKKAMGVLADKDQARQMATQLIPSGAEFWPLKKHDGRAEAALIAQYGRQHLGG
jgi:crossover junction endodeoxyribonuclease RuvC